MAEGIPYAMAMSVSVVLYKRLGISNTDIALYTSWLYLPWVIKPLWSPLVDLFRTKRSWVLLTQLLVGASLASVALTIPTSHFFQITLALFWWMAFCSATHDIAADGYYLLGLPEAQQAAFVGVRTTFYRLAMIAAQGGLVVFAGSLEGSGLSIPAAWATAFLSASGLFFLLFLYHALVLPFPDRDRPAPRRAHASALSEFLRPFLLFFKKRGILSILAFLLFYRFAETQIVKIIAPFLLDPRTKGGLERTTSQVGMIYGTVGVISLMAGGLLGGYAIYRKGLRFWIWIWIMASALHLPDLVYVYLSQALPSHLAWITLCVAFEQFGYGFGFTAYTMFMMMISEGEYRTVHYAIATGLMALAMMGPAMFSGWIQEQLGYSDFFLYVMMATLPGFIVTGLVKIDPGFGKRKDGGRRP